MSKPAHCAGRARQGQAAGAAAAARAAGRGACQSLPLQPRAPGLGEGALAHGAGEQVLGRQRQRQVVAGLRPLVLLLAEPTVRRGRARPPCRPTAAAAVGGGGGLLPPGRPGRCRRRLRRPRRPAGAGCYGGVCCGREERRRGRAAAAAAAARLLLLPDPDGGDGRWELIQIACRAGRRGRGSGANGQQTAKSSRGGPSKSALSMKRRKQDCRKRSCGAACGAGGSTGCAAGVPSAQVLT